MARTSGFNKRSPRIDVHRRAVLINSDGIQSEVTLLDISSGGFRLELSEPLRIGEFVTLRVERSEELPAQIRWALGNEAGGVFLAPAPYEQFT
jgi:hypothetical protein